MSSEDMNKKEGMTKTESIDNGVAELQVDYTAEEERAVLRKIDRVVLPLMCLCEFFQCE